VKIKIFIFVINIKKNKNTSRDINFPFKEAGLVPILPVVWLNFY